MNIRHMVASGMAVAAIAAFAGTTTDGVTLQNGQEFTFKDLPAEMSAQVKRGASVRFLLEENGSTGYQW